MWVQTSLTVAWRARAPARPAPRSSATAATAQEASDWLRPAPNPLARASAQKSVDPERKRSRQSGSRQRCTLVVGVIVCYNRQEAADELVHTRAAAVAPARTE